MKDALGELPGYALRRASDKMLAKLSNSLANLDLRRTEATMLVQVQTNPDITPSALGEMLEVKRANMVPLVAKLEGLGYITRIPINGRSFGLRLTELGVQTADRVRSIMLDHEQDLMARIPKAHREHLLPALTALWRS